MRLAHFWGFEQTAQSMLKQCEWRSDLVKYDCYWVLRESFEWTDKIEVKPSGQPCQDSVGPHNYFITVAFEAGKIQTEIPNTSKTTKTKITFLWLSKFQDTEIAPIRLIEPSTDSHRPISAQSASDPVLKAFPNSSINYLTHLGCHVIVSVNLASKTSNIVAMAGRIPAVSPGVCERKYTPH